MRIFKYVIILAASLFLGSKAYAFTASYEQTVSGAGMDQPKTSYIKIKDNKMKMVAVSPEGEVVNIMDGKTVYSYFPSKKMAVKFTVQGAPKMDTLSEYGAYLESLGAKVVGTETIDQYECDIYEFTDPRTNMPSKVWLWKKEKFPVKIDITVPKGVVTTVIRNLEIGANIDDSEFVIPPGVEINEIQAGSK